MEASAIRVGVNLLTCNLVQCPLHVQAARYAIDSLLDSDLQRFDWRLVIVDNGSTCPETVQMLQDLERTNDRVLVEWMEENIGIARGRNVGYQRLAEWHAPHYVVEVHTDHVFPAAIDALGDLGWLAPILEYMEAPGNERSGIVGPALLTGGGQWYSPRPTIPYRVSETRLQEYPDFRREVTKWARAWRQIGRVAPGLSHPAVKRWAMIEEIGIHRDGLLYAYDPDMPGRQNFEDTEEAFRAYKAGWELLIHFGSVVFHHYHFTRMVLSDHGADYDANSLHSQRKHGPEFIDFATRILGGWMDMAYRSARGSTARWRV